MVFAVETMMQKVLALPGLAAQDRDVVLEEWQEYRASFPQESFKTSGEAAETVPGFHRLLLHVRAACSVDTMENHLPFRDTCAWSLRHLCSTEAPDGV